MFTTRQEKYCMRWEEFRVRALCQMTPFLIRKTTLMTLHPTTPAEFVVDPSTDFRFKKGSNHGLDKVFIYVTCAGPVSTKMSYPGAKAKFSDEGGNASDGNLVYSIRNDDDADKQFEYFVPNHAKGYTEIGLARINQSIQAFCYSVLGAHANSQMSIIGNSGSAKNTQIDFLTLVDDAIKNLDASNGNQKYQNTIEKTKNCLDFSLA